MSQYTLDCEYQSGVNCTIAPYTPPPATVDHYSLAPTWSIPFIAVIVLAAVVATAIVRYRAHEERGSTQRTRILNPPKQCPTCGDKIG